MARPHEWDGCDERGLTEGQGGVTKGFKINPGSSGTLHHRRVDGLFAAELDPVDEEPNGRMESENRPDGLFENRRRPVPPLNMQPLVSQYGLLHGGGQPGKVAGNDNGRFPPAERRRCTETIVHP